MKEELVHCRGKASPSAAPRYVISTSIEFERPLTVRSLIGLCLIKVRDCRSCTGTKGEDGLEDSEFVIGGAVTSISL